MGGFVFVVTGGGTGLGRALAEALAKRDQSVCIVGRREHLLVDVAKASPYIQYVVADVSTNKGRTQVYSALKDASTIQGLIHNTGIIEPIVPMTEMDESSWRKVMATNLDAPLFLSQLLQNQLINGRVLSIGSGAAHFPVAGWSAYCVSKAALSMLTRCWQLESKSIAFANVMPGIVDTDMQAYIRNASHMDLEKLFFFKELQGNQRLLLPQTVALFLCWLLLDIDKKRYVSQEWDIYDKTHHPEWLVLPHQVPTFEEGNE